MSFCSLRVQCMGILRAFWAMLIFSLGYWMRKENQKMADYCFSWLLHCWQANLSSTFPKLTKLECVEKCRLPGDPMFHGVAGKVWFVSRKFTLLHDTCERWLKKVSYYDIVEWVIDCELHDIVERYIVSARTRYRLMKRQCSTKEYNEITMPDSFELWKSFRWTFGRSGFYLDTDVSQKTLVGSKILQKDFASTQNLGFS